MHTTTIRPRTPLELAVLLPYQLGYHPGPSVVLVVMHGKRLGMLQRHDLGEDGAACAALAVHALTIAVREEASSLLLLGFEDEAGQAAPLLEAMTAAAAGHDLAVGCRVVVHGGRGEVTTADGETWTGVLPRPEDVPGVAAYVHAGVSPLPSRAAFVADALPARDEQRAAAVGRARHPLGVDHTDEMVAQVWARLLDPGETTPPVGSLRDDQLRLLGESLLDVDWRDALMTRLCPGTLAVPIVAAIRGLVDRACDGCPWAGALPCAPHDHADEIRRVRQRLAGLAALLPLELTPGVHTLLALLTWWSGDGTVASTCLEEALRVDPDYRLADLLSRLLAEGLRPWDPAEHVAHDPAA